MALYGQSGVSVESWVEMTSEAPVRYEADATSDVATLYFGHHDDYVLTLSRENLAQVISLGNRAIAELSQEGDRA